MDIIYIDSYFFLNLVIDYLILLATAKLCSLPLKRLRYGLAALFGALWSVFSVAGFPFLAGALMKLALSFFMALIAYGGERRFFRAWAAFLLVSAAFGGAVWAASMLGGQHLGASGVVPLSPRVLILSFGLCYAAMSILFRHIFKKREREILMVFLSLGDRFASFPALRDTGNELFDPLSGLHVCVAERGVLAPLFPPESAKLLREEDPAELLRGLSELPGLGGRFRLVPYAAVGVPSGLLLAFRPDRLTLNGVEETGLLVALSPTPLCTDGEYAAIL
jgi:stage II sporulation protein GA (sporulation sigma-E factor processing peptidase)